MIKVTLITVPTKKNKKLNFLKGLMLNSNRQKKENENKNKLDVRS